MLHKIALPFLNIGTLLVGLRPLLRFFQRTVLDFQGLTDSFAAFLDGFLGRVILECAADRRPEPGRVRSTGQLPALLPCRVRDTRRTLPGAQTSLDLLLQQSNALAHIGYGFFFFGGVRGLRIPGLFQQTNVLGGKFILQPSITNLARVLDTLPQLRCLACRIGTTLGSLDNLDRAPAFVGCTECPIAFFRRPSYFDLPAQLGPFERPPARRLVQIG